MLGDLVQRPSLAAEERRAGVLQVEMAHLEAQRLTPAATQARLTPTDEQRQETIIDEEPAFGTLS